MDLRIIRSIESARRAQSYLREHRRNDLSAFDADVVPDDVEVGQWGAEKNPTEMQKRGKFLASDGAERMPFCS